MTDEPNKAVSERVAHIMREEGLEPGDAHHIEPDEHEALHADKTRRRGYQEDKDD